MTQKSAISVLVVDSNPLTSDTLVLMLTSFGYQASRVENAGSAINALSGVRFDVLIENMAQHNLEAAALAKTAKLIQPEIRVIVSSGSFGHADISHPAIDGLLQKPFGMAKLKEVLQAVLQKPSRWPSERRSAT